MGQFQDIILVPASFSQERIWFLEHLYPDRSAYLIPHAYRFRGFLDIAALKQSLDEIVSRHEVLRTTFTTREGRLFQVINPFIECDLNLVDFSDLADDEREWTLNQAIHTVALRSFDLSKDCMIHAVLYRLGVEEHVLLLVMHHIASDGWSLGVLLRELGTLYRAIITRQNSSLPPLPIQYADFSEWQRERMRGTVLEEQLSYWRGQLADLSDLGLNCDFPRPSVPSFRAGNKTFSIDPTVSGALNRIMRESGVTLYMILLAAYQVLLARYTGRKDIAVGSPIANRNRVEIENLIGFFVNTLVMRIDLGGDPSFVELLKRVRSVCLEAYSHQDLPFEQLVAELDPVRKLDQNPLCQVTFALQNFPQIALNMPGLTVERVALEVGSVRFDLECSVSKSPRGLVGNMVFSQDLFRDSTVERMTNHFLNLLSSIAENPNRRISHLPMLGPDEKHKIAVTWNRDGAEFPQDKCIHHLVEEWAFRTPKEIAVVCEKERLTYQDLNARANQLAFEMIEQGMRPESVVGICAPRSIEILVGILGILKAGAAYLPLDPAYPQSRLDFMLADAKAQMVLVSDETRDRFSHLGLSLHGFTAVAREATLAVCPNPNIPIDVQNLAYIMYTSGSTGRPKGVMISHRNVIALLFGYKKVVKDGPRRIGTSVATFSFDTSVEEFFANLCFGGTLHLVSEKTSTDEKAFARYLVDNRITTCYILPFFMEGVAAHLRLDSQPPNLRCVITGLQAKKESVLQSFRDVLENVRIINAYGPTEVTYGATALVFDSTESPDLDAPIGKPIPNYRIYIVDEHLELVPIGVVGELIIGGRGLSRGYRGHPGLTAERFVPDPFGGEFGARLYRTGDLARYRPDGNIEFIGRADHQIKIRGFRVELGEIESVLKGHPSVDKAVVTTWPGDDQSQVGNNAMLVAYVVVSSDQIEMKELRQFLKRKLPAYMIPAHFRKLDALPLTPSGKIDRDALPAPDCSHSGQEETPLKPRSPVEQRIAKIWAEVLKVEQVGVNSDFFELGGHSLLALRINSRIRDQFDVDLTLRVIFECSTVEEQALVVEELILEQIEAQSK